MNLQEVRDRILKIKSDETAGTRQEVESFCASVIAELPRSEETANELNWAYGQIIHFKLEEGLPARAMRMLKQYISDCAPVCDETYNQTYIAGLQATGSTLTPLRRRDRFYSLIQLLRKTLVIEGLVAECGCFRGLSSYLLCSTLKQANSDFTGEGYRIFDSFEGLSPPQTEDIIGDSGPDADALSRMARAGNFRASIDQVKTALCSFPQIEYYPGWIPQAFPDESESRYRFVHVDVDIYQPTRDSFEYFWPRLVPGGMIVSDDYNWPGARKAIEQFSMSTGAKFEVTPYSQAYFVRR